MWCWSLAQAYWNVTSPLVEVVIISWQDVEQPCSKWDKKMSNVTASQELGDVAEQSFATL